MSEQQSLLKRFWEDLHEGLTNVLLACVLIHVTGVLVASRHDRENLALSMLHGRKRPAGEGDIA